MTHTEQVNHIEIRTEHVGRKVYYYGVDTRNGQEIVALRTNQAGVQYCVDKANERVANGEEPGYFPAA